MVEVVKVECAEDVECPIITTFPGVSPQEDTHFRVFKRKQSSLGAELSADKRIRLAQSHRIIFGENDRVEYQGDTSGELSQSMPCRYAIGVYNKRTKKLVIHDTHLAHCEQTVKALHTSLMDSNLDSRISNLQKRDLGQAFGTRKAKQAINAYERNQVDVNMLGGAVSEQISSQIDGKATVLATADDIEREMNANRLVPPFNDQTEKVELIYPFEQLITTDELDALPYHALMQYKKKDFKELRENGYVLYTQRCTLNDVYDYDYKRTYPMYVMERLEPSIIQKNVKRVQSLLYLTYLLRFREMKDHQLSRSDRFQEAMMVPVPSVVQERLLSLFTERQDGKKPGQTVQRINNSLRAKLTAYICALCLHIDSFAVNCGSLAQDLKIPVSKTQDLFKQIGCTSETKKIGDETVKMARLTAPLRFPKPPKGMRAKRQ